MLDKILTKLVQKMHPERNISVEKIDGRFFWHRHDTTGCNSYLLEGTYSYDDVVKLNELTGGNAAFGICDELGSVAFIGMNNPNYVNKSGYFRCKVHAYGMPFDESEYYFKSYTEEEAKNIHNYKVYGGDGLREVAKVAKISQLNYHLDSRYTVKEATTSKVFNMDCKLKGVYSYNLAKLLATGSIREKDGYSGDEHPIVFAIIDDSKYVGIINMWNSDKIFARGFMDVWEYGTKKPNIQKIRFLSNEEASEVEDFELYIYNYACSGIGRDKYQIEKFDRTLDVKFNFHLPDGTDYRLIDHTELFK
mgnify:CR=1 FL=1